MRDPWVQWETQELGDQLAQLDHLDHQDLKVYKQIEYLASLKDYSYATSVVIMSVLQVKEDKLCKQVHIITIKNHITCLYKSCLQTSLK